VNSREHPGVLGPRFSVPVGIHWPSIHHLLMSHQVPASTGFSMEYSQVRLPGPRLGL